MRVLVACEFSGVVRDAFAARGHDAWSNDLLPTEVPGNHIQGDCVKAIGFGKWDLIVMHPPCTALAVSGNRWYGEGMPLNDKRREAIRWTLALWSAACAAAPRVCMKNPVGVLPIKPTQYVQPWQFGHGETKRTGLWLHGLNPLQPTNVVDGREARVHRMPPSDTRWMERSRTYQGVADAMADQWGASQQDEVERLRAELDARDERIALLRAELADLEALRNTTGAIDEQSGPSIEPLSDIDDSVVQGVTKRERSGAR